MGKKGITVIVSATLLLAVVSTTTAFKQAAKHRAAETEIENLRTMLDSLTAPSLTGKEPIQKAQGDRGGTEIEELKLKENLAATEVRPVVFNTAATEEAVPLPTARTDSFEERMAQMKLEDPEGYARMIEERRARRQSLRYNLAERTATFMDMDTTFMSEQELESHNQLVEKMAAIFELTDRLQDPEQQPQRETMQEFFSNVQEARPLMEKQRSVMFRQLAVELGYGVDDATALSDHLQKIVQSTTLQMPRRGVGRRQR